MLDEKDILVWVHTRNILRARGCYRYVKVPSSPYKRGHKGTCKRIQTFWNLCYLQRESQSLCALTLNLNVLRTLTCVRVVIRTFRVAPQHLVPTIPNNSVQKLLVNTLSLSETMEQGRPCSLTTCSNTALATV
jgi:hypothetical protein